MTAGHHQPASETPFEWRFAGGPIVTRDSMLAGSYVVVILGVKFRYINFSSIQSADGDTRC